MDRKAYSRSYRAYYECCHGHYYQADVSEIIRHLHIASACKIKLQKLDHRHEQRALKQADSGGEKSVACTGSAIRLMDAFSSLVANGDINTVYAKHGKIYIVRLVGKRVSVRIYPSLNA